MRSLEAPNPLNLSIRPGEEPVTNIDIRGIMTLMVMTAEFFDRAAPNGTERQIVKTTINGVITRATSKSVVAEMFADYMQTFVLQQEILMKM